MMDDNLKIAIKVFQLMADTYDKFLNKYIALGKMLSFKETSLKMWHRNYEQDVTAIHPRKTVIEICLCTFFLDDNSIVWEIEVFWDKEFIYCEGRVFKCLRDSDDIWLEVDRKAETLTLFEVSLAEIANEILEFPIPDSDLAKRVNE